MKKLLVFTFAGLFSLAKVSAQNSWSIAPTLGMNFSTVKSVSDGKESDDIGYRGGFSIGATAEYLLKPKIYFRPSVNIASSRGYQSARIDSTIDFQTMTVIPVSSEMVAKITYFDLIADIKYALGEKEKAFVLGGLYYGLALSGTYTLTRTPKGGSSDEDSEKIDFGSASDQYRGWDAGLGIGLGYRIDLAGRPLELTTKYNLGIINQSNSDKTKVQNRFFSISLSYYLFNVGSGSGTDNGTKAKPTQKKGAQKDEEL